MSRAAITGPMAKMIDTSARLMPCLNMAPASAGPTLLPIRDAPITRPTPEARTAAGKVSAAIEYSNPAVPARQKPIAPAETTNSTIIGGH